MKSARLWERHTITVKNSMASWLFSAEKHIRRIKIDIFDVEAYHLNSSSQLKQLDNLIMFSTKTYLW